MKYMGSKSVLLSGRLGRQVLKYVNGGHSEAVDLFAGAGSVSHFMAERTTARVVAVDQQTYSKALALSVIGRDRPLDPEAIVTSWIKLARERFDDVSQDEMDSAFFTSANDIYTSRLICSASQDFGFVRRDYGGHYFSPTQALAIDCLLAELGASDEPAYWLKLGALLRVASRVSASPGHTAQPFQPTPRLLPYILDSWRRDVFDTVESVVRSLAPRHARVTGSAWSGDAAQYVSENLSKGAVVFCDPPYSDVQYSRFYHVLEGIARGGWPSVSGSGRAPELAERNRSLFSLRSSSRAAFEDLFEKLAKRSATTLLTFPAGQASNGLSGGDLTTLASNFFAVRTIKIPHTHSTLGGPAGSGASSRTARRELEELLMIMTPSSAGSLS